ncbi:MAG: N-6 DNA methylase [Bacteroidia bacterium]|nr:N-6 DNA methylase [Bacteroidia bacterium]
MLSEAKTYQAYYTRSAPIVDYMVNMLSLKPADRIFEPCAGDGVFVDALLNLYPDSEIDVCELNTQSVKELLTKFSAYPNVHIRECDTLLDEDLNLNSCFGGIYDKIIANPPYGAWQDYSKRTVLKKIYPDLYIKESYALFLYRSIELLKEDGILSFIIPDTFLNLHTHKALREHILSKTQIIELALFPSSFFPGVNFGYANLSIITLRKKSAPNECMNNTFPVIKGFNNVNQLYNIHKQELSITTYKQGDIFHNPDHAFYISDNNNLLYLINHAETRIGDIAECVTGFYSGDDKQYLRVSSPDLRNGKNYEVISADYINNDYSKIPNVLNGIEGKKCFIPIVKGGNAKYIKPENWYMNWSSEAVYHYKTDKKARFQNPRYYFRFGIGVPMISSSSISASLIEKKLFDQSIVGVFPKDESITYYLLAFFNSPTCNKLIRTINPSANNPANYIKKIPFIIPEKSILNYISEKTIGIIDSIKTSNSYDENTEFEIWEIIKNIYKI